MIHKYVTFGQNPELRNEPVSTEFGFVPEVEICTTADKIWQIQDLISEIRYARATGTIAKKQFKKLVHILVPIIVNERERNWLRTRNFT